MNFPPEQIGVGKYTGELADWFGTRGYAVEVVTAQPHYPGFRPQRPDAARYCAEREGPVRVIRCPLVLRGGARGVSRLLAPLTFAISAAPVLVWRALRSRPAVILCVEPTLFAAPAAILAARLVGAALVLHVQDLEVDAAFASGCLRGRGLRRLGLSLERPLLQAFDRVVTISTGMAARLAAKGVKRERLTVVRNWTSDQNPVDPAAVDLLRARLGIDRQERVICYAGHLGAKQDVPTLLHALAHLLHGRAARVVIAGDGPLVDLVSAADLPGLIRLPLQSRADHRALLELADVHVLTQDARTAEFVFPSKLGPMLATGRPVVIGAAAGSDMCEWVGDAAYVVPPGDPVALADGLGRALDDACATRRAAAIALARTLDAATVLPAMETCLLDAIAAAGRTGAAPALLSGLVDSHAEQGG